LAEEEIHVMRQNRVRIEPMQRNCDYVLGEFLNNAAVEFATKFSEGARNQFDPARTQRATVPGPGPVATVQSKDPAAITPPPAERTRTALSFKATVLDENGNLLLEGGERIRVRIDLVNGGEQELQQVTATLSGTPSLLSQFPATTLSAGRMQPGQSRSLEFAATLPQSAQPQKAELHVTVAEPGATAPPPQILSLSIHPIGIRTDDVDQVPAVADGFKRPHTYLLSVGIGSYRDQQLSMRKYGASDAEIVANYFQSLGGLPASNVRLLQDWKALRPDIDEVLLDWLPARTGKDTVIIVYFAGIATVSPTGEIFLIPYDGNMTTTTLMESCRAWEPMLAERAPFPTGIHPGARPPMLSPYRVWPERLRMRSTGMDCLPTTSCGRSAVNPTRIGTVRSRWRKSSPI
jgi:hypothetical protein